MTRTTPLVVRRHGWLVVIINNLTMSDAMSGPETSRAVLIDSPKILNKFWRIIILLLPKVKEYKPSFESLWKADYLSIKVGVLTRKTGFSISKTPHSLEGTWPVSANTVPAHSTTTEEAIQRRLRPNRNTRHGLVNICSYCPLFGHGALDRRHFQ